MDQSANSTNSTDQITDIKPPVESGQSENNDMRISPDGEINADKASSSASSDEASPQAAVEPSTPQNISAVHEQVNANASNNEKAKKTDKEQTTDTGTHRTKAKKEKGGSKGAAVAILITGIALAAGVIYVFIATN